MSGASTLGQRIRELRLKIGLTQIDLAKGLCTPSMISQIESDRARPSYKMLFSIAERLNVPLDRLLVDVDLNLEYVSTYKMARAMVASKEYLSAIPLLRELLDTPRNQISSMEILFDLGECYLFTHQLEEAEQTFSQVQELAILRQDHLLSAQVLKHFGQIAFQRKNYHLSVFQWQKAVDEIDKMDEQDVYLKASILHLLGEAHLQLGYVSEAVSYFDRASSIYEGQDSLNEIGHVYMGLGMSFKMLGELSRATDYLERASSIFAGMEQLLTTLKIQVSTAAVYGETDRVAEAEQLLHSAIPQLKQLGYKEVEGTAYTELAQLHFQKDELDKAEEMCRQARTLLPELHVYQAKTNRVLGRVALKRGNIDEAKRRLQMAADGFKRSEELGQWDDTMFELCNLYLNENDQARAIRMLVEMRSHTKDALRVRGIQL